MEHRRMCRIRLIGAVYAAGADDADGRLARGHHACLHRRGLRTQNDVVLHIEGILRIARRMVLRHVQQFEIVMIVFHFGAFYHFIAHAHEDIHHAIQRDVHRMQRTRAALRSGQGYIHGFLFKAHFLFLRLQFGAARLQRFLDRLAHIVDQLTHSRPLLCRKLTHAAQQRGKFALLAQHAYANLFKIAGALRIAQIAQHALPDLPKLLFHNRPTLLIYSYRGAHKKLRPLCKGRSIAPLYHPTSFRRAKPLIRITRMNPFAPTSLSARRLRSELHRGISVQRFQPMALFSASLSAAATLFIIAYASIIACPAAACKPSRDLLTIANRPAPTHPQTDAYFG